MAAPNNSMQLEGKTILLGITGGIAAYKSCNIVRLLQKRGARQGRHERARHGVRGAAHLPRTHQ